MGVGFKDLPFWDRPDLTPYLIHLTKNTKSDDNYSAYNNLVNILTTGKIWGSDINKGFIKGNNPATCFMDVPFNSLKYMLNDDNSNPDDPRYEPYGIFISKKIAYESGARPVLYLSNDELRNLRIPSNELWRVVRFEVTGKKWISWIHEREWRAKGDFILPQNKPPRIKDAGIGILVKSYVEVKKLMQQIETDPRINININAILPLEIICQGLQI